MNDQHQQSALLTTLQALRKRWGASAIQPLSAAAQGAGGWIPFGVPGIPPTFGAGFPRGRISELIGAPTSGVSTFMLRCMGGLLSGDQTVIVIDPAHVVAPDYAAHCGVRLENLLLVRPARFADGLSIAGDLVISRSADLVVIATGPEAFAVPPGALQTLAVRVARSDAALVILTPDGDKPSTAKSCVSYRLRIDRIAWLQEDGKLSGWKSQVTVVKNKLGAAGQTATFCVPLPERLG